MENFSDTVSLNMFIYGGLCITVLIVYVVLKYLIVLLSGKEAKPAKVETILFSLVLTAGLVLLLTGVLVRFVPS
jgi:hypothetical protein